MERMQFNIDKGMPMPPARSALRLDGLTEAMKRMEVGDSIALPRISRSNPAANIRSSAAKAGIKIAVRKMSDTEMRFWRVG